MKKLREIPKAWKNGDDPDLPSEAAWDKDRIIDRLEAEGHQTISVGRGVVVIEQCEPDDDYPSGWVDDPLKITVHPDPDAGFSGRSELFVHAHRAGLMDVYLRAENGRTWRLIPMPPKAVEGVHATSQVATATALAELSEGSISGYYGVLEKDGVVGRRPDGTQVFSDCVATRRDEKLANLAEEVHVAIRSYVEHLRSLPDVFLDWDDEP